MRRTRIAVVTLVMAIGGAVAAPMAASAWRGPQPVRQLVPVATVTAVTETATGALSGTNGTRWT